MENSDFNLPEGTLVHKVRAHWLTQKPNPLSYWMASSSLIALLVSSFVYWRADFGLSHLFAAVPIKVFQQHEYWRLWSALFVHADIGHLLSNSFLFSIFSYFLFGYFGSFVFPFMALIFGGLVNYIVLKTLPPTVELVGISGVVYWMGAVWLTLYFLLETREAVPRRLVKTIGIAAVLFIPETYHQNISYLSHFIGFVSGVVFALFYYWYKRTQFQKHEVIELVEA